jgi:hypothetical protein
VNGHAKAVMWIGLFLIAMNVIINWQTIRSLIFTGGSSSNSGGSGGLLPPPIANLLPGGAELRSAKQ